VWEKQREMMPVGGYGEDDDEEEKQEEEEERGRGSVSCPKKF
jgi:hypothetical protein